MRFQDSFVNTFRNQASQTLNTPNKNISTVSNRTSYIVQIKRGDYKKFTVGCIVCVCMVLSFFPIVFSMLLFGLFLPLPILMLPGLLLLIHGLDGAFGSITIDVRDQKIMITKTLFSDTSLIVLPTDKIIQYQVTNINTAAQNGCGELFVYANENKITLGKFPLATLDWLQCFFSQINQTIQFHHDQRFRRQAIHAVHPSVSNAFSAAFHAVGNAIGNFLNFSNNPKAGENQHTDTHTAANTPEYHNPDTDDIEPVMYHPQHFDDETYRPIANTHRALRKKYHNLTPIGDGAQATMFRALDHNNRPVGIKIYDFGTCASWKADELFEREVQTIKNLHFKGIPKFIEYIDSNPLYYLVESYIPAPSMAKRIKNGERIDFENALMVLVNIAKILAYLESRTQPVIHRDIKPDNLLIDDEYNVWLVDFGVVAASNQKTNAMTFAGTAGYMAPEQLMGKVTPAADIYSTGISMLSYLTGKDPIDMNLNGLYIDVKNELPSSLPKWFRKLILDMTEPLPEKRISNAFAIIDIIRDNIPDSYEYNYEYNNDNNYERRYQNQNHAYSRDNRQ